MLKKLCVLTAVSVFAVSLSGCVSDDALAPVVNAWQQPKAANGFYRVQKGDTLYSIAWAFGLDYRALAKANHLSPPYTIDPGEKLRMISANATPESIPSTPQMQESLQNQKIAQQSAFAAPTSKVAKPRVSSVKNTKKTTVKKASYVNKSVPNRVFAWSWPAKGKIIGSFSTRIGGNQGIDISGNYGESIKAAASGRVVYSGSGVRGYGNLIIIKHTPSYLSAYAFNKRNLVADGAWVQRGETIALMGRNNAGVSMLHFEIRKNGKPVNPLNYLRQG